MTKHERRPCEEKHKKTITHNSMHEIQVKQVKRRLGVPFKPPKNNLDFIRVRNKQQSTK